MKYGAALALIFAAVPLPALAQRGFAHGGSFGNRGGGGHATFSARPGFSSRPAFSARPIAGHPGFPARPSFFGHPGYSGLLKYGPLGPPPTVRFNPPRLSNPGFGGGRNNFVFSRPAYRSGFAGRSGNWDHNGNRNWGHNGGRDRDHDGDRDRDRFRDRARSFQNWYFFSSPGWLGFGYPYYFDPGFFDLWDAAVYGQDNQDSGNNDQGYGYQVENPSGEYGQPDGGYSSQPGGEYSSQAGGESYGEPGEQPPPWPGPQAAQPAPGSHFSVSGLSAASAPPLEGPLTVVFKGGRAPETMQNYMVTSKALTDLDPNHYQQIPLDQIDIAATMRANRANGLEFQIPGASQD